MDIIPSISNKSQKIIEIIMNDTSIYKIHHKGIDISTITDSCKDNIQLEFCNCSLCEDRMMMISQYTNYNYNDIVELRHIYKEYKVTFQRWITYIDHSHIVYIKEIGLLHRFFTYFTDNNIMTYADFVIGFAIIRGRSTNITTARFFFDILSVDGKITEDNVKKIFHGSSNIIICISELILLYCKKWDTANKGYASWEDVKKGTSNMNPTNRSIIFSMFKDYWLVHKK